MSKNMKILLIQPYGSTQPPLGLCLLAAVLKKGGYSDIALVDLLRFDINVTSPIRTWDYLEKKLEEKPDAVLITGATPTFTEALEIAKMARPHTKTVLVGGSHATIFKERILEKVPYIDVVVYGEADETICKQMESLQKEGNNNLSGITGVCYRDKSGKIIKTEQTPPIMNLDNIPWPDRDIIDLDSYHGAFILLGSRGCPHACTFCSRPVTGATFRGRSPKNVVDEIDFLLNKYPETARRINKTITFSDENAAVDKQRLIGICDELIKRKLNIKFVLTNGLHVTSAHEELYQKLAKAGCVSLWFGVEQGTDKMLKTIRKGATENLIKKAVRMAHEAGIPFVGGHFMIGVEEETLEDARHTIKFAKEAGFDATGWNHAAPTPGTPLWDYVMKHGKLLWEFEDVVNYSNFKHDHTEPQFETPEFTREQRKQAYEEAIKMMDEVMRSKIMAPSNIAKFLRNSITHPEDLPWAAKRLYNIHTKRDLRRHYDMKPSMKVKTREGKPFINADPYS